MYVSMDERVMNVKPKINKVKCELKQEFKMQNLIIDRQMQASDMSSFITDSAGENARYGITL